MGVFFCYCLIVEILWVFFLCLFVVGLILILFLSNKIKIFKFKEFVNSFFCEKKCKFLYDIYLFVLFIENKLMG